MIHDDLFREFDEAAREYGWTGLGQPEQYTRRYGREGVTVRVYANRPGTAVGRVTAIRLHESGVQEWLLDEGARRPRKRDAALLVLRSDPEWLRYRVHTDLRRILS